MTDRRTPRGPRKRIASQVPLPPWQAAVALAARAHRHQIRKDGATPYVSHVFRVALTVSQVFGCGDENVLAIAILHDTIEDTTTDYDDLHERFGPVIADGVAALTKNMALPEHIREPAYDQQLAAAAWYVRLVKLADAFDNLCDVASLRPELMEERRRDATEKARRAIALATVDAAEHPETRTAIAALGKLLGTDRHPGTGRRGKGRRG
ncbi:MAG: HD domain-containing protein [Phycisphaerales bacterium]